MAMPAARGLFHRAIVMSGSAIRLTDRERAAKLAEAVLMELGLSRTQLAELQMLPFRQLIAAIRPARRRSAPRRRPCSTAMISGRWWTARCARPSVRSSRTAVSGDIPVLVGGVKDEMAIYLAPDDSVWERKLTEDELRARIASVANGATDRVLATYRKLFRSDPLRPPDLDPDGFKPPLALDHARRAQGRPGRAPVWLYSFDWETPVFGGRLKAFHALDVPFVFETIDAVG